MATLRQLLTRLSKLECRNKADAEFQIIEQHSPETETRGACDYVLVRNSKPIFRFPAKLSPEEWVSRYSPNPN